MNIKKSITVRLQKQSETKTESRDFVWYLLFLPPFQKCSLCTTPSPVETYYIEGKTSQLTIDIDLGTLGNKIILEKAIHKLLHKIIHDSHNLLFDVKRVVIDNVGLGIGDMK